jgi:hypothetical protein
MRAGALRSISDGKSQPDANNKLHIHRLIRAVTFDRTLSESFGKDATAQRPNVSDAADTELCQRHLERPHAA